MSKQQIKRLIADRAREDGLTETGIEGVQLFRSTEPIPCAPTVYAPCVVAIVSGSKEVVSDGRRHVYGNERYLCCPMTMPLKAGTPAASPENPLYGVLISLDRRVMTGLTMEMQSTGRWPPGTMEEPGTHGICLARWDDAFADALLRVLNLGSSQSDTAILGEGRLREVLYAVLNGDAGASAKQAFGAGNAVARSIAYMSSHLGEAITIDDLSKLAGMSRAAFHRKFKTATAMAPMQFVKAMRLNEAAMQIAAGGTVGEAARNAGYASPSQFSREFRNMYGQSPRQWGKTRPALAGVS